MNFQSLSIIDSLNQLGSDPARGLTSSEVQKRLQKFGPNRIQEKEGRIFLYLLWDQISNIMIVILLVAAAISAWLSDWEDSVVILVIVVVNGAISIFQDYRAEQSLRALKKFLPLKSRCLRDGTHQECPSEELVPGDIVLLESGELVPADLRLLESHQLQVEEAPLTGESVPVNKFEDVQFAEDCLLPDRLNMLFKGTLITKGRGKGLVAATGDLTEFGKIAQLLEQTRPAPTPLQRNLQAFTRKLTFGLLGLCGLIFVAGLLYKKDPLLMFLTATALAVAAVPEALPSVVTLALALGARHLAQVQGLIRRLASVETLGAIDFICTDKTGTLTMNLMTVEKTWYPQSLTEAALLEAMVLNNDASLSGKADGLGDPTELALLRFGDDKGCSKASLETLLPRTSEIPFDPQRAYMITSHRSNKGQIHFIKGAPEVVIKYCLLNDPEPVNQVIASFTRSGLRVLAFARKTDGDREDLKNFEFLGLAGLLDPPRPGVLEAVATCKQAGIRPVMITGDHPETARGIAERLKIWEANAQMVNGSELQHMSAEELYRRAPQVRVFARTTPDQKIRIVEALQANGYWVAMTGDGVNDGPAVKKANIGIAMGKSGTEVARQAADLVLLDDNFATIVKAIREGRRIFENISKSITFILIGNFGEILAIGLFTVFGLPAPLQPVQILWVNLVTDGFPGLALAVHPADRDIMMKPPRSRDSGFLNSGSMKKIGLHGGLLAVMSMVAYFIGRATSLEVAQSMAFTTLSIGQLFVCLALSSPFPLGKGLRPFQNPYLIAALSGCFFLQAAATQLPWLSTWLKAVPLNLSQWASCLGLSLLLFSFIDIEKRLISGNHFTRL